MKILFLALDIDLGNNTGDSIHVRELATSFAKLGNEVFLIAAYVGEDIDINWAKSISNLHIFFNKPKPGIRNLSTLLFCKKIIKTHKPQLIYERRNSPKIGVALRKWSKIPVITEINGIPELEAEMLRGTRKGELQRKPLRKKLYNYLYNNLDAIVAVTPGIKREIINSYNVKKDKIYVIPNGANLELFRPLDQYVCREKLGLDKNDKIVCFVGNLAPWQGVEWIIEASPQIIKMQEEVKFLIVGPGVLEKTLKKMVADRKLKDRFIFTGKVDYEQVPVYINASDVCIAPFIRVRNERIGLSPLKIYEYLACEKPVVASDIEGVGDFLKETKSGIAVAPEDHLQLAQAVIELLNDESKMADMGRKGREIVVKDHGWDSVAQRIIGVASKYVK